MNQPVLTRPPKVKTLAQQKADFTAEGAPPPGKAAISGAPTIVLGAHKRLPSGKSR